MTHTPAALPNDGPNVQWALAHAKQHLIDEAHKARFVEDICVFQYCRDHEALYWGINRPIKIDGVIGYLRIHRDNDAYGISIGIPNVWIGESFARKGKRLDSQEKRLEMTVTIEIPITLVESLVGRPIERLIQLPDILHPIITGRTVLSATQVEGVIDVLLSGDAE